LKTVINIKK